MPSNSDGYRMIIGYLLTITTGVVGILSTFWMDSMYSTVIIIAIGYQCLLCSCPSIR